MPSKTLIALLLLVMISATSFSRESRSVNDELLQKVSSSPTPEVATGDWPWWRGPDQDNLAGDQQIPTTWTDTENVLWKVDVPGRGHSSPTLWGDRIFLTTAKEDGDEEKKNKRMLCYRRSDGKLLWDTLLHEGGFMSTHAKNSQASATVACDGKLAYVPFMVSHEGEDAIWVSAVDFDGKIVWQKKAGGFVTRHGFGSSPLIYKSLLIVAGDNKAKGFLSALDRSTGEIVWSNPRGVTDSFATPVVAHLAGRDQLLIHGINMVNSFDPNTGKELWHCEGHTKSCANTITFDKERIYASGGWPDKYLFALRADGSGDVTETHMEWKKRKGICYVPSMLLSDNRLYAVNDKGIAHCYNAETGEELWTKRLKGAFSASLTLVGDNLYIPNEAGKMYVFKAADKFEKVAENDLADGGFATPVVVGDRMYLRTNHHLYCIGKQ